MPRKVRHSGGGDDTDDIRRSGGDQSCWEKNRGSQERRDKLRALRTVLEVQGDHSADNERHDLRDVTHTLEHGGLGG